jgi:hypothetical protein
MTVFFTSCQKIDGDGMVNTQNTENATEDSTNTEENMKETDTIEETGKENPHGTDDLAVHKQMLLDTDSICGVIYLGYVDSSKGNLSENEDYLKSVLDKVECARNFDFIYHIAKERIVESDGGSELYCIYPYDENASVAVNQCVLNEDGSKVERGEVLYKSEKGAPILLRCNVSEIYCDTEIVIVDSKGRELVWQPGMSMENGKVQVPVKEPYVYDNTNYDVFHVEHNQEQSVEERVKEIRQLYNTIQDNLSKYTKEDGGADTTRYWDKNKNIKKITASTTSYDHFDNKYNVEYFYEDNTVFFIFIYNKNEEHRIYLAKNDGFECVRYIDAKGDVKDYQEGKDVTELPLVEQYCVLAMQELEWAGIY